MKFDRPTISLESSDTPATESVSAQTYHRAIFNTPSGVRIFGPWMRSIERAISALARTMSADPERCAKALLPLVVTGAWVAS